MAASLPRAVPTSDVSLEHPRRRPCDSSTKGPTSLVTQPSVGCCQSRTGLGAVLYPLSAKWCVLDSQRLRTSTLLSNPGGTLDCGHSSPLTSRAFSGTLWATGLVWLGRGFHSLSMSTSPWHLLNDCLKGARCQKPTNNQD